MVTGMAPAVSSKSPHTRTNAGHVESATCSSASVAAVNAATPTPALIHHGARRALQL